EQEGFNSEGVVDWNRGSVTRPRRSRISKYHLSLSAAEIIEQSQRLLDTERQKISRFARLHLEPGRTRRTERHPRSARSDDAASKGQSTSTQSLFYLEEVT